MNARQDFAAINKRTDIAREILADLNAMNPIWPMPVSEFNDDDIYVYVAESKKLVRQIVSKDQEAKDAKYIGVKVMAGQSWAKGMTAKSMNIWRPDRKATAPTTDAGVAG